MCKGPKDVCFIFNIANSFHKVFKRNIDLWQSFFRFFWWHLPLFVFFLLPISKHRANLLQVYLDFSLNFLLGCICLDLCQIQSRITNNCLFWRLSRWLLSKGEQLLSLFRLGIWLEFMNQELESSLLVVVRIIKRLLNYRFVGYNLELLINTDFSVDLRNDGLLLANIVL